DGKIDLVVGCSDGTLAYFKNTGTAYAQQTGSANPFNGVDVGQYSAPALADVDRDGDLDAVVGEFDITGNPPLNYFQNTGTTTSPTYTQQTGTANPFNSLSVGANATVAFADVEADGDLDLVVGCADGTLSYFQNTATTIATSPTYTQWTASANPFV